MARSALQRTKLFSKPYLLETHLIEIRMFRRSKATSPSNVERSRYRPRNIWGIKFVARVCNDVDPNNKTLRHACLHSIPQLCGAPRRSHLTKRKSGPLGSRFDSESYWASSINPLRSPSSRRALRCQTTKCNRRWSDLPSWGWPNRTHRRRLIQCRSEPRRQAQPLPKSHRECP